MTILFGSHISISKGLVKSIDYANSLGCKVMQIFSQSPRSFKGVSQKNINAIDKANEKLREQAKSVGLAIYPLDLVLQRGKDA